MFLASTSDLIRVVTGSAVSTIGVQSDYVDSNGVPGRTNTAITTAATTTVVASPAASTQRNVKSITITNNHATSSNAIKVQHFDGTTSVDVAGFTLNAGERLTKADDGTWRHISGSGADVDPSPPPPVYAGLGITGTIAETVGRELCEEANGNPLTGILYPTGIILYAGQVVTNISMFSGATAAGTPTNWFFALYNENLDICAQSANQTTTAWAANTIKTLAMGTAYTVPKTGLYYVCFMMTATTMVTLKCTTLTSSPFNVGPTKPNRGASTSGLTTVLPSPMAAVTQSNNSGRFWAAIT
jgi:hypothetical protein